MNFRTTIVLLVLVIAAGWFYVEFVKDEPAVEVDKPGDHQLAGSVYSLPRGWAGDVRGQGGHPAVLERDVKSGSEALGGVQ